MFGVMRQTVIYKCAVSPIYFSLLAYPYSNQKQEKVFFVDHLQQKIIKAIELPFKTIFLQSADPDNASPTAIKETLQIKPKMAVPWEDIDTMIVIGYLFVYDTEWQDVPQYLQKHLIKRYADTKDFTMDEFEPKEIEKRWVRQKDEKLPIYEEWSKKSKEDKEVRDYCFYWGMWV